MSRLGRNRKMKDRVWAMTGNMMSHNGSLGPIPVGI
jgi:hypothetical protein